MMALSNCAVLSLVRTPGLSPTCSSRQDLGNTGIYIYNAPCARITCVPEPHTSHRARSARAAKGEATAIFVQKNLTVPFTPGKPDLSVE